MTNQYYNPYQYQNPYLDRLNSLQQYQQALQQPIQQPIQQPMAIPSLNGKVVDNFDSITVNDVPMGGQAVFIKSDGTEIQTRSWGKTGLIDRATYKLVEESVDTTNTSTNASTNTSTEQLAESIMSRFDDIDECFDSIGKQLASFSKTLADFGKASQPKSTTRKGDAQ